MWNLFKKKKKCIYCGEKVNKDHYCWREQRTVEYDNDDDFVPIFIATQMVLDSVDYSSSSSDSSSYDSGSSSCCDSGSCSCD